MENEVNGDAPSLTIGYVDNAPAESILVKDNIILGRNNALRLLHVKSMTFENNIVYGGYVFLNANEMQYSKNWKFDNNRYFTKKNGAFRVNQDKTYALKNWQNSYQLDMNSRWNHIKEFDLEPVLSISEQVKIPNIFNIALFNKQGQDVEVDFSEYKITKGTSYRIYDVENRKEIVTSGIIDDSKKIIFPMNISQFEKPLHNEKAEKTLSNFGVFMIDFDSNKTTSAEELNSLQKLLKWLGF
jgi:hypothetical protein